jgi:hypothetical protein
MQQIKSKDITNINAFNLLFFLTRTTITKY